MLQLTLLLNLAEVHHDEDDAQLSKHIEVYMRIMSNCMHIEVYMGIMSNCMHIEVYKRIMSNSMGV